MARYVVTTFRFRQLSTTSLLITRQQIEIKTMDFQQPNTTISTRELRLLIEDHLKALWEERSFLSTQYAQAANLIPPLMIWGAPGVGKSTSIRELAQSMNIGFIDVRLAQREPVDMRGAVTESMMLNQLAARHPNGQIRILSASYGKTVSHTVRYQMKRGNSAWTNGTVTLNNALTESMARNQLKAKFPGASIRILSFVKKK